MQINLYGKNALVCGSTQGIGKATAIQFAESGASVTLFARDEARLKSVINDLSTRQHQKHNYLVADFSNPEKLFEVLNNQVQAGTNYHIIVNNTGGPAPGTVHDAEPEQFIRGFKAHLVSAQYILKSILPGMKNEKYGRIINIISTSVKVPIPGLGVSNTIRGAVANWSKTLATELAPWGITVNNILPGFTDTERLKTIFERRANDSGISLDKYTSQAINSIPARRLALPAEIAYAITFLASDMASYITGINLPVDGGSTPAL